MDIDQIIAAFGGTTKAAAALKLSPGAVSTWRKEGIPAFRWKRIVAEAASRGIRGITLDVLAAAEVSEGSAHTPEPMRAA